jgi:hypothetical protein
MIAIETRYAGPTATKPGRIIATTANGQRHVISYPHGLDQEQAHYRAAWQLAIDAGWLNDSTALISAGTKRGYAFVFVPFTDCPKCEKQCLRQR